VFEKLMKQALISDIILDYVKSPVEGENIYPNFFRQTTIKNSQIDFRNYSNT
jgi:hypothetical protein